MSCPLAPAVANPAHRLTEEVGGTASGIGAALAQPGHQHVAGAGGDSQQGVIAAHAAVAVVAGTLFGQSVGLADGGIQVDGQRPIGRVRPAAAQARASNPRLTRSQLADVAPPEAAQEGSQGGGSLDRPAENLGGPARAQHVGVVDAVAAGQCGGHQCHQLVAWVGPSRGITQIQVAVG